MFLFNSFVLFASFCCQSIPFFLSVEMNSFYALLQKEMEPGLPVGSSKAGLGNFLTALQRKNRKDF